MVSHMMCHMMSHMTPVNLACWSLPPTWVQSAHTNLMSLINTSQNVKKLRRSRIRSRGRRRVCVLSDHKRRLELCSESPNDDNCGRHLNPNVCEFYQLHVSASVNFIDILLLFYRFVKGHTDGQNVMHIRVRKIHLSLTGHFVRRTYKISPDIWNSRQTFHSEISNFSLDIFNMSGEFHVLWHIIARQLFISTGGLNLSRSSEFSCLQNSSLYNTISEIGLPYAVTIEIIKLVLWQTKRDIRHRDSNLSWVQITTKIHVG